MGRYTGISHFFKKIKPLFQVSTGGSGRGSKRRRVCGCNNPATFGATATAGGGGCATGVCARYREGGNETSSEGRAILLTLHDNSVGAKRHPAWSVLPQTPMPSIHGTSNKTRRCSESLPPFVKAVIKLVTLASKNIFRRLNYPEIAVF